MSTMEACDIVKIYRRHLEEIGVEKHEFPHQQLLTATDMGEFSLAHCYNMLDKMEEHAHAGKMEEFYQELGFVKGVLWAKRIHTLDQLETESFS